MRAKFIVAGSIILLAVPSCVQPKSLGDWRMVESIHQRWSGELHRVPHSTFLWEPNGWERRSLCEHRMQGGNARSGKRPPQRLPVCCSDAPNAFSHCSTKPYGCAERR